MKPEVGHALWVLLHAYAMVYPDAPTEADKRAALYWLKVFTAIVRENSTGCNGCATEWEKLQRRYPPRLERKIAFQMWAAAAHDHINKRIGIPLMYPHLSLTNPNFLQS